ncbi:MAG: threonylcarbamoyl-AMP synthase [Candidatus Aminicenantes bacterium]|nr:threonylcarbamoyl-AMP synthase [Candidatus Aminicenantes bacterium]
MNIETRVIKINPPAVELDKIKSIAQFLKKPGVMAFPTDTFYGLGADCFSPEEIRRIYRIKKRKMQKPIPLMIAKSEEAKRIAVEIPPLFWSLAEEFWPGPLTLVLKASPALPPELLGHSQAIGVRLPAVPWLRELVREAGFPLTATSANISGEKEINRPEKIKDIFWGKVDLIVDGGKTPGPLPSTVLDMTSEKPRIIREGMISVRRLRRYLSA